MPPIRRPLSLAPPLRRADALLLEAVRARDGERFTLATAGTHPGFTVGELLPRGDGAPPRAGIFVSALGRLVYRLFVAADGPGCPPDTIAKAVLGCDVRPMPYGALHTSYLAVRRGEDAPVLIPFPEVPFELRKRPSNVKATRAALHQLTVALTEAANVGLFAGRMLHTAQGEQ